MLTVQNALQENAKKERQCVAHSRHSEGTQKTEWVYKGIGGEKKAGRSGRLQFRRSSVFLRTCIVAAGIPYPLAERPTSHGGQLIFGFDTNTNGLPVRVGKVV